MLGIVLIAYIFHEMDERLKDVPTSKEEGKERNRIQFKITKVNKK